MAKLGPDHSDTLQSKHNVAMLYWAQAKFGEAEPLLRDVLALQVATLGPDHPDTLLSRINLGTVHKDQRQYDQAEPLYREALAVARKKLGLAHNTTQLAARHLINCYESWGRPAQAQPLLRELADFHKVQTGVDSLPYAGQLAMLGLNLLEQQKGYDAEAVLRPCFSIRQEKEPDAWSTFNAQSMLGAALLQQGKHSEAEPLLLAGWEGMQRRAARIPLEVRQLRLTEALERLVQLYAATGQKDKGDEWQKKLEETKAAAKPPAKP
jgi:tetratricopeptide (TPR) repeat protein